MAPLVVCGRHCGISSSSISSVAAAEDTADLFADFDLSAYEDLLLNAAPKEAEVNGGEGGKASPEISVEGLLDQLTTLLPSEGEAVRLTDLTPSLDVEAISEAHGSVLSFIQLFPAKFTCESIDGRWLVRRTGAPESRPGPRTGTPGSTPAVAVAEMDLASFYAGEELRALGATHTPPAPNLTRPTSSAPASAPAIVAAAVRHHRESYHREPSLVITDAAWSDLHDALPAGDSLPVAAVRSRLPDSVQKVLTSHSIGLTRLVKEGGERARAYVELSADGSRLARPGVLPATWSPPSSAMAMPPDEGFRDAWDVSIDLDNEEEEDPRDLELEDADPAFEAAKVKKKKGAKATASPKKTTKEPPPKQQQQQDQQKKKKRSATAEELMKAHTALAERRGWYTPAQMLDLFVECVPTFFVPVGQLRMTDTLARMLGPQYNAMDKVMKIYPYFFEFGGGGKVARLRPSVPHPQRGSAGVHYSSWDPTKADHRDPLEPLVPATAAHSSAFPVLPRVIKGKIAPLPPKPPHHASSAPQSSTVAAPRTATRSDNPFDATEQPLYLRVCSRVPFSSYVSFSEAAELSDVTAEQLSELIKPTHDAQKRFQAFLVDREEQRLRLRPFWSAPCSTGDLSIQLLPPAFQRSLRPMWTNLDCQLGKLTVEDAIALRTVLAEHTLADDSNMVVSGLRLFGSDCWVSEDGLCVRRYTASADLDDMTHLSIYALSHHCGTSFAPLTQVLAGDSEDPCGLLTMLSSCLHDKGRRSLLFTFLRKHSKIIEVQRDGVEDGEILVRRRTAFVPFPQA